MARGIDYAFNPHPSAGAIAAAGMRFVGRYVSPQVANDHNGKNLLATELKQLRGAGLSIILFAEQFAGRMKEGHAAGVADAKHFDAVTKALNMSGAVMFSACDYDAPPGDQPAINAYQDGVISVLTLNRTGIYGSFYVVKRCLDARKAKFACQTLAWSGGQWESRAQLRQHLAIVVGGVQVDLDDSWAGDFGQWPRPAPPKPAPKGPTLIVADGTKSFADYAHEHSTDVSRAMWLTAQDPQRKTGPGSTAKPYYDRGDLNAVMPSGARMWVGQ